MSANGQAERSSRASRIDWWQHARFGMFVHYGLYAIPARGEWVMLNERVKIADYEKLLPLFNPRPGAVQQWARRAKEAGMRYMVLTAKHHDGFCLFDTALTDYNALRSGARRDLVREYVDACRAEGLRVGLYYSIRDWHHPNYPFDPAFPLVSLEPDARKPDKRLYLNYMLGQLRELLSHYGKIDVLWFDGRDPVFDGKPIAKEIRSWQPDILINDRLIGNVPDFVTPEQTTPRKPPQFEGRDMPWEACHTMTGQSWGYCRHEHEADFRPARKLIRMLAETAGAGGNFLLNVGPRPDGSLRPEEARRLRAIGAWMKKNGASLARTGKPVFPPGPRAASNRSRLSTPDYVVRSGRPLAVNADLHDALWRNTPAIAVSQDTHYDASRELYPGAARHGHCSYEVRAMHAGGTLYWIVDVESETRISRPHAVHMLNCDAVRFLVAANTSLARINYSPESFEIVVDARGNAWMPNEAAIPGAMFRHAVRPSARGYVVMLAVPLSVMRRRAGDPRATPRPGQSIRFNIVVTQPSPPVAAQVSRKPSGGSGEPWWRRAPADYTPHGERHWVFWKGRAGDDPLFNVQAWGVWRLSPAR